MGEKPHHQIVCKGKDIAAVDCSVCDRHVADLYVKKSSDRARLRVAEDLAAISPVPEVLIEAIIGCIVEFLGPKHGMEFIGRRSTCFCMGDTHMHGVSDSEKSTLLKKFM